MLRNHNSNKYSKEYFKEYFFNYRILKDQVNMHYQHWWGGPTNPNPRPLMSHNNILDV